MANASDLLKKSKSILGTKFVSEAMDDTEFSVKEIDLGLEDDPKVEGSEGEEEYEEEMEDEMSEAVTEDGLKGLEDMLVSELSSVGLTSCQSELSGDSVFIDCVFDNGQTKSVQITVDEGMPKVYILGEEGEVSQEFDLPSSMVDEEGNLNIIPELFPIETLRQLLTADVQPSLVNECFRRNENNEVVRVRKTFLVESKVSSRYKAKMEAMKKAKKNKKAKKGKK